MQRTPLATLSLIVLGAAIVAALGATTVFAQFGPPATVFGSISDADGTVPEGVTIEAYIGNTVCGRGRTQFTGDGSARVTVYFADVVSREQTAGCGAENLDVRIKVGDRFAAQTSKWRAGPVQLDLTFGNATPAPIPTFTPAPTRTPSANSTTPTIAQGATSAPAATATPSETGTASQTSSSPGATRTATLAGGLRSNTPPTGGNSLGEGDDGGFPVWGVVIAVLGGVAVTGGIAGIVVARSRRVPPDADDFVQGPPGA
jgi:hypothetical protein